MQEALFNKYSMHKCTEILYKPEFKIMLNQTAVIIQSYAWPKPKRCVTFENTMGSRLKWKFENLDLLQTSFPLRISPTERASGHHLPPSSKPLIEGIGFLN